MKNTLLFEVVGCLVLVLLLSWSTVRSQVVMAEIYAVYLRELSVFGFSTHSVFIIGNLIIIVVVVQSAKLSEETPVQKVQFAPSQKLVQFVRQHQYDVADESMKTIPLYHIADQKIEYGQQYDLADRNMKFIPQHHGADQEIEYGQQYDLADRNMKFFPQHHGADQEMKYGLRHDVGTKTTVIKSKEAQSGFNTNRSVSQRRIVPHKSAEAEQVSAYAENSQLYRRTQSASYERGGAKVNKMNKPELMRSKTFNWGGGNGDNMTMAGRFDELNHDEFRRKIESFIAKQRELIREEWI